MNYSAEYHIAEEIRIIVKTIKCMQNNDVFIEDDTCLDRILTLLHTLCCTPEFCGCIAEVVEEDNTVFNCCKKIIQNASVYQQSISVFAVKLFAILNHDKLLSQLGTTAEVSWKACLEAFLNIDIACEVHKASYQCAWLWSFSQLLLNASAFPMVFEAKLNVERILSLTESSSMFVVRNVYLAISKLIIQCMRMVTSMEKSFSVKGDAHTLLERVAIIFGDESSLDTALKVMTECFQADLDMATSFLEAYVKKSEDFFLSKPIASRFFDKRRNADVTLANFIQSLKAMPKWLSSDCLHNLTLSGLLHAPLRVTRYTILASVSALTKEKQNLYHQLVITPFQCTLGATDPDTTCDANVLVWLSVIRETLISSSNVSIVLCNSAKAWLKMWPSKLLNERQEKISLDCFNKTLRAVYELDPYSPKIKPQLLQNFKVAFSILTCLKLCIQKLEKCWCCVNEELRLTLMLIMKHPDTDHQVLERCCVVLLHLHISSCSLHSDSSALRHLFHCLSDQLEHLRWKNRDTALEMLNSAFISKGSWGENVKTEIIDAILLRFEDDNSYVRSSALNTAKSYLENIDLCLVQHQIAMVRSCIEILLKDTEALPRRSAVDLLATLIIKNQLILQRFLKTFSSPVVSQTSISTSSDTTADDIDDVTTLACDVICNSVMVDLDWEVKRNGLKFLLRLYESVKAHDTIATDIKKKVTCKVASLLETGQSDCDRNVSEYATDTLAMINGHYSPEISKIRQRNAMLEELHSLLQEVEYRLTVKTPRLSHNNDNLIDDEVLVDCY